MPNEYNVRLYLKTSYPNCQANTSKPVEIYDDITLDTTDTVSFDWQVGCPCNKIEFSQQFNSAKNWYWNFGSGDSAIGINPSYEFSGAGPHIVTLLAENPITGCIQTIKKQIAVCEDDIKTLESKSSNHWYFGDSVGLSFQQDSLEVKTDGQVTALEGISTISDPFTGEFLFYVSSGEVRNSNHQVVKNGLGLKANFSASQGLLVVPLPGDHNKYYIFHSQYGTIDSAGYYYSVIDIEVDSIISKNNLLYNSICYSGSNQAASALETFSGTTKQHESCNENAEYWVVHTSCEGFHTYLINDEGISSPIVSSFDRYSTSTFQGKFSATGNLFALGSTSDVELYEFDKVNGKFYNKYSFKEHIGNIPQTANNTFTNHYGIEFSPNERYLYVGATVGTRRIRQYDLLAANPASSEVIIYDPSLPQSMSLELGIDGKIYVAYFNYDYLGVIHKPNEAGLNCDFELDAIYLKGKKSRGGLQNIIPLEPFISEIHDSKADFVITEGDNCYSFNLEDDSQFLVTEVDSCSLYYLASKWTTKWLYNDMEILNESALVLNDLKPANELQVSRIIYNDANCFSDTATQFIYTPPSNEIFIPNAISTNEDGLNESITLALDSWLDATFLICDRFGKVVYNSNNSVVNWSVDWKSKKLSKGTYTYYITGKSNSCEGYMEKVGTITVLR